MTRWHSFIFTFINMIQRTCAFNYNLCPGKEDGHLDGEHAKTVATEERHGNGTKGAICLEMITFMLLRRLPIAFYSKHHSAERWDLEFGSNTTEKFQNH